MPNNPEVSSVSQDALKDRQEKEALHLSIEEKDKAINELKNTVSGYDSQLTLLKKEISLSKERQAKTMEQLARATTLNNTLQERIKYLHLELELIQAEEKIRNTR